MWSNENRHKRQHGGTKLTDYTTWTVLDNKTLKQCEKYNQSLINRRHTKDVKISKMKQKIQDLERKLRDEENKLYEIEINKHRQGFEIQMKPQVHRHYETSEIQTFPDEVNFYDNITTRIHIWEMKDGSWKSGCIAIPCINGGSEMDESKTYFRVTTFKEATQ